VGINIYAGSDARNTPRRVHTQGGEEQSKPFQLGFNGFLNVAFQGSRLTSEAGLIPVRRSTPGGRNWRFSDSPGQRGGKQERKLSIQRQSAIYSNRLGTYNGNPRLDQTLYCRDLHLQWDQRYHPRV
jgi:hypothetical protein